MTSTTYSPSPSRLSVFLLAIRPRTLPASLSPVILGTALVAPENFNWLVGLCALGVALFLQIAVNLANDFFDAKNGVDGKSRLGPIRVTQANIASPTAVIKGIVLFVALAIACGLVLVFHTGWPLLLVGLLCVLATLAYSGGPYPLASHGLGEITVLVFFGWIAVMGSFYVHTQQLTLLSFWLATALGLVLAAIMLVNNLRDIKTDRSAGKITLAVMLGDSGSRLLYTTLILLAALSHLIAFGFTSTRLSLLQMFIPLLVCLPHAVACCRDVKRLHGRDLNRLLATTAVLGLIYASATAIFHITLR